MKEGPDAEGMRIPYAPGPNDKNATTKGCEMNTPEALRQIGVIACRRCHGSGLVRPTASSLGFCDCATGRALWDAALARALDDVTAEITP